MLKDPKAKVLWDANHVLFYAPSIFYVTIPKTRTDSCIFDSGAIEMSIMLAAKDHEIDSVPAYEVIKYPDILRKYMKIFLNFYICCFLIIYINYFYSFDLI